MGRQKNDSDPPVKNRRTTNKTFQPTTQPVKKNGANKKQLQDTKKLPVSKNPTTVVKNDSSKAQSQDQQRRVSLPDPSSALENISKGTQRKNPQKPALLPNSKSVSEHNLNGTHMQNLQRRAIRPVLRDVTQNVSHGMQLRNHQGLTLAPVLERLPSTLNENSYAMDLQNALRSGLTSSAILSTNTTGSQTTAQSDFARVSRDFICPTSRSVAVVTPNNCMLPSNSTLNNTSGIGLKMSSATSIVRNPSSSENRNSNQFGRHGALSNNSTTDNSRTRTIHSFQNQDDDDVAYLFTIDSTPNGQIIEEIDLSQESDVEILIPDGASSSVEPTDPSRESMTTNVTAQSKAKAPTTKKKLAAPTVVKTRKRKASDKDEKPKKRANIDPHEPRCSTCEIHYDQLISSGEQMCISTNCGHLFCLPCIRKGEKVCEICGTRMQTCRKLYL